MDFTQFAGLELLRKSYIKNLVIERLDNDPSITDVDIGRVWFNKTEKRFKVTLLDGSDVVIKSLSFFDELNSIDGSSLIGYEGWTGIYGKFNIPEGTLKSALDLIADKLDENTLSIDDINNGSIYNLQEELNRTQFNAGLSIIDGSYTPDPSANYIDVASTLFEADQILDTKLKEHDDIISDISESIDDSISDAIDSLYDYLDELQAELDFTQTIEGCGLEEDGSYTPDVSANYIDIANNLYEADQILDNQVKSNRDIIDNIVNNTAVFELTEDIYGNPLWKGDRWPVRDDLVYKIISPYNTTHSIEHNLGTIFVLVNAWIKDPSDNKFKSDIVNTVIEDENNITIYLSQPKELMLVIEAK